MSRRLWMVCALLVFPGCGDDRGKDAAGTPTPAPVWGTVSIQGLDHPSDFSIDGTDLIAVRANDDRRLYVVDIRALSAGGTRKAVPLDLTVQKVSMIQGADDFARAGYRIEHVWSVPVAFTGIALREGRLYLAERHHRLIYWGHVARGPGGSITHAGVEFAFSLRGGERAGAVASDWRDQGPGLRTLTPLIKARRSEDLYALDRSGGSDDTMGLRKLDRVGGQIGATLRFTSASGTRPDARGVVWQPAQDRFLALVGPGRGALVPFQDASFRTVRLGAGVPTPTVEGVAQWIAIAQDAQGTLYLLSDGAPAVLAWRAPDPSAESSQ